ncbi:MAG: Gfo/Idh/MocA family protein [Opitutales bacterium]
MSQEDQSTKDPSRAQAEALKAMDAPLLQYEPRKPKSYRPKIGLIGCGGITKQHLTAYKKEGYEVVALCDLREEAAQERQKEYYPEAKIYTNPAQLLERDDIEVVDIALHPKPRAAVVRQALEAGKHVLSQKPFVLDLDLGQELIDLAEAKGRRLAVNQNGRWAPYVSYARELIQAGHLGDVYCANVAIHWNHTWCAGTEFEKIHHLILYDFGIHWFDMLVQFFGDAAPTQVFASTAQVPGQVMKPPMLANASVVYPNGGATLTFNGHCESGPGSEVITIAGTKGILYHEGGVCGNGRNRLMVGDREASIPELSGTWMPDGFRGTMGELLCAIEEDREPMNSARNNLQSLAVCFAAMGSADAGRPLQPGEVRQFSLEG